MRRFEETLRLLESARETSDSVLVAYSGGKDSNAVLDLCVRTFKRVECFFQYLIPGLEHVEAALAEAQARYDLPPIRQYPHFVLRDFLKNGTYCPNHWSLDDLPEWKLRDIYNLARSEAGIQVIATGMKRADSQSRRMRLGKTMHDLYPLLDWNKLDVLAYLKIRGIPAPSDGGHASCGVDLSTPNLLWLYDTHPRDFERLEEVFPYIRSVVYRREWYGVGAGRQKKQEYAA